jgi:hypothetical protein
MDWATIELLGYTHYSKQGYRILIPLVRNHGYDFVAERNGEYVRVNVKVAGLKSKRWKSSWSISIASGSLVTKQPKEPIDIYLAWLPHQERFIELPGNFFDKGNSKSKLIPRELL